VFVDEEINFKNKKNYVRNEKESKSTKPKKRLQPKSVATGWVWQRNRTK
jgi:hypothetical protein